MMSTSRSTSLAGFKGLMATIMARPWLCGRETGILAPEPLSQQDCSSINQSKVEMTHPM